MTRNTTSDFYLLAAAFAHAVKNNFNYKACYSFGVNPHVAKEVAQTYRQMLSLAGQAVSPPSSSPIDDTEGTANPPSSSPADDAEGTVSPSPAVPVHDTERTDSPPYSDAIQKCHLAGFIDQLALRMVSEDFELVMAGTLR